MRLYSAADCAGVAIVLHKVMHARQDIISADQFNGLVLAVMGRKGMVVLVPEYLELKVIVVQDVKSIIEEQHAIPG